MHHLHLSSITLHISTSRSHHNPTFTLNCRIIRSGLDSQEAERLLLLLTSQKAASPNVAASSNCRHRAALLPAASFHLPSAPIYGHYQTAKNRQSALVSCIYLETLLLLNPDTKPVLWRRLSSVSTVDMRTCSQLVLRSNCLFVCRSFSIISVFSESE